MEVIIGAHIMRDPFAEQGTNLGKVEVIQLFKRKGFRL